MTKKYPGYLIRMMLIFISHFYSFHGLAFQQHPDSRKYFINAIGNDKGPGTYDHPWKTLAALNQLHLHPGDAVYLQAGQVFKGRIELDSLQQGSAGKPVMISSYGAGRAIIDADNETGIIINRSEWIVVENLELKGSGRKQGNTGRGIWINGSRQLRFEKLSLHGFQKSGLELTDCADIRLQYVEAYDNGYAGISVTGNHFPSFSNKHIYIAHCMAHDNPGDPTELNNHSGNGIVVGLAKDVMIEFCSATNNGWDMPRVGNGPVGIWAWEADSVTIQHCVAYRNRTTPGAADGGGFDLDGGVTHSIVQYNLSYENEGYGYGIFQFSGATPWHDNTFRYNISIDDGNKTQNGASVLWWNGSRDAGQFYDCYFYNNLLYNSKGYALGVVPKEYDNKGFLFLNNIIVGKDEIMNGGEIRTESFYGNDWWSLESRFKLNGDTDFKHWTSIAGHENIDHSLVGFNLDPQLIDPVTPTITDPAKLKFLTGVKLKKDSPLRHKGLDLFKLFNIDTGFKDYFGNPVPRGAPCEPGVDSAK
jgi:Right handed beta helix region